MLKQKCKYYKDLNVFRYIIALNTAQNCHSPYSSRNLKIRVYFRLRNRKGNVFEKSAQHIRRCGTSAVAELPRLRKQRSVALLLPAINRKGVAFLYACMFSIQSFLTKCKQKLRSGHKPSKVALQEWLMWMLRDASLCFGYIITILM